MRKLLLGLLMLVTTNVMAAPVVKPAPPSFEVTSTTICRDGISYYKEESAIHITIEKIFQYNKSLNAWRPQKCTSS